MPQKIFVVIAYGGEYDDAWEKNVCAKFTETDAQLEILELEERRDKLKVMHPEVSSAFYAARQVREPMEEVPKSPKGPSKTTKENMRLHREAVEAWRVVAQPIIERNQEREKRAYSAAVNVAREKAIELGADERDLQHLGFTDADYRSYTANFDCDYRVEELELS